MPEETLAEEVDAGSSIASVILHPFVKCISLLNFGYAIHPTEPIHLANSEFITVQDGYKIRILHLQPDDGCGDLEEIKRGFERSSCVRKSIEKRLSMRNSMTEEYWFTRWNKPLQAGNRCSCSFRRSQRYSKLTEEAPKAIGNNVLESPPTKIKNLETFVERLLQETLLEAYQELYITNSKTAVEAKTDAPKETQEYNYDNLGYVQSPDEIDAAPVVIKRRKDKPVTKQIKKTTPAVNTLCRHNKPKINVNISNFHNKKTSYFKFIQMICEF